MENLKLYDFIKKEASALFKKIYGIDSIGEEDAAKLATILSCNPNFKIQYDKIRNIQTQCINDFPELLPLWTSMFIRIIEIVEFSEIYYKNLKYIKNTEIAFEKTFEYFYNSGLRHKRTNSKI